jgi:hypothetical protein
MFALSKAAPVVRVTNVPRAFTVCQSQIDGGIRVINRKYLVLRWSLLVVRPCLGFGVAPVDDPRNIVDFAYHEWVRDYQER